MMAASPRRVLVIDTNAFTSAIALHLLATAQTMMTVRTVPGAEYTCGGPTPEKRIPQLKAHQRSIAVLGPKRGRWK